MQGESATAFPARARGLGGPAGGSLRNLKPLYTLYLNPHSAQAELQAEMRELNVLNRAQEALRFFPCFGPEGHNCRKAQTQQTGRSCKTKQHNPFGARRRQRMGGSSHLRGVLLRSGFSRSATATAADKSSNNSNSNSNTNNNRSKYELAGRQSWETSLPRAVTSGCKSTGSAGRHRWKVFLPRVFSA